MYRRAKASGTYENLSLSRLEMDRSRIRRKTDRGTDVGLILESGDRLHHGDVLWAVKFIVVRQLPEKVISLNLGKRNSRSIRLAALIGHAVGNRHRPIAVSGNTISFPVIDASEVETFRKGLPNGIKFRLSEQVFLADSEAHGHGAL